MLETDALTAIKTECAVLAEALTDTQLTYFLNKYGQDDGTGTGTLIYDLNRAIYDALGSAMTVLPKSYGRGGVSYTRDDLTALRDEFRAKILVGSPQFPGVGIGVIVRDLSR